MPNPATAPAQLTHGPVGPILWRLLLPMVLGVFFLMAVNFVDTYFVGLLGVEPLAAMSFTFPVISIILGLTMGLGVGATSSISRAIGGGEESQVKKLTTHALILAVLVVVVISFAGLFFQRSIFTFLGAKSSLLPLIEEYMTIWFIGVIFLVIPIVGNGAMRATGDARSPMLLMMGVAILNGILDPILIFGLGWGLKGAAIATLIARAVVCFLSLYLLGARLNLVLFERPKWSEFLTSVRSILSVGLPASLTNLLAPMAATAVTTMIAKYGSGAMAAYGLGGRVESLFLIVPMVLGGALSPFIGQNWGAHLPHRVVSGIRFATIVAVSWGIGAWLLVEFTAPWVAPYLSKDTSVQSIFVLYLRILSAGYIVHGIVNIVSASFNATDYAIRSTILSASQGLLLAVPLATLGNAKMGLSGIFVGLVVAKYLTAFAALRWLKTLFTEDDLELSKMSKETAATLEAIESVRPEFATKIEQLVSDAGHWEGVTVGTARRNTLSFRVKGREIGHIHSDARLHLPFAPTLRDELVASGKVFHHSYHHDSCWVTFELRSQRCIEHCKWLLQLNHLIYLTVSRGWDAPQTSDLRKSLDLSDSLQQAVQRVANRCQMTL